MALIEGAKPAACLLQKHQSDRKISLKKTQKWLEITAMVSKIPCKLFFKRFV